MGHNTASRNSPWAAIGSRWPIVLGLSALYIPTLFGLFSNLWTSTNQMHGPIIFSLSMWLLYRNWHKMQFRNVAGIVPTGWILFLFGLLLYIIGRSQLIIQFELGSLIFVLAGMLMVNYGVSGLSTQWFPLFFLLFMIPLPGTIVIMLTMPMKTAVSYVAENLIYAAGLPIARSGVILQIGQYQLLVADACAGLQTLLTLEALGLFYLNIVRHTSFVRNISLALLIIPISFSANVIRVLALTLITYYLGEAAGQGFLHIFAGLVLFMTALLLIMGFDKLLQYFVKNNSRMQGDTGHHA